MTSPDGAQTSARPVLWGAVVAAGLVVALALWFGRACWGGWWVLDRSMQPDTYLLGTLYQRWAAQVSAGHLPIWFPEFAAGYPVHAAWMYGLFYPPLALFLVLPPEAAWTWLAIAHAVFGALGMYAFLWRERRDVAAAASGAIVFATSGFVLGRLTCGHLNLVMPLAWAPWVMLAAVRVVDGGRGAAAWLGLCVGAGLLAGHVQTWFYVGPLVAALALYETARGRAWRTATPRLLLGAALALGVAAIQWAPAWELFVVSGHPAETHGQIEACSVPLSALAAQIAPRFAGLHEQFAHEYVGLAGPLAVGAALLAFRPRDGRRWFWFVVLVLGLVMATGVRTAPGEFLSDLPPFRWARTPGRALSIVVLAGGVLAGHAVADFFGGVSARRRALAPAAFLASAFVFGVPAPDAVRTDFLTFDWTRVLPAGAAEHRVVVNALRRPYVEARGLRSLRDVCPFDTPGYRELTFADTPWPVRAWWFDAAAVIDAQWDLPPADAAAAEEEASRAGITRETGGGAAQFFPRATRVDSFDAVLARLRGGERGLWVDETSRDVGRDAESTQAPHAVARVSTSSPTALSFDVAPRVGWLLVSEKWYPGWMSRGADGAWSPVARGNLAFIAVEATDAARIEYRPWWLWPALVVSLLSLIAAATLVLRCGRRP